MQFQKSALAAVITLVSLSALWGGCSRVPNSDKLERIKSSSSYKGKTGDLEVFLSYRERGKIFLPGDRLELIFYNSGRKSVRLDYYTDEYYYYSGNAVYRAHIFTAGGSYPKFVGPGETARVGLLTDVKDLSISGFEIRLHGGDLVVYASKEED